MSDAIEPYGEVGGLKITQMSMCIRDLTKVFLNVMQDIIYLALLQGDLCHRSIPASSEGVKKTPNVVRK